MFNTFMTSSNEHSIFFHNVQRCKENIVITLVNVFIFLLQLVTPVDITKVTSPTYPYIDTIHGDKLKAIKGWANLGYNERYNFVWYNTYVFIPNQPGNPYKF